MARHLNPLCDGRLIKFESRSRLLRGCESASCIQTRESNIQLNQVRLQFFEFSSLSRPTLCPVPVRTRNCGLAGFEVEIMMVPSRGPSMAGLKVTSMAQVPPAGKVDGHVFVSAKSMPEVLMSRTVRSELLMLVRVAILDALVAPTGTEPKSRFGGVSLTTLEAFAFNTTKMQSNLVRHEFTVSPWTTNEGKQTHPFRPRCHSFL